MKQQDFIALIEASQTTLKQDLLIKHPESKYQLLMLLRSYELLKQYILQAKQYDHEYTTTLNQCLNSEQSITSNLENLVDSLRDNIDPNMLLLLRTLNNADLKITHPKLIEP